MGLGLGVVLLVAGLVLAAGVVDVGTAVVDDGTLGWILIGAGALTMVSAVVMNARRARSRRPDAVRRRLR